jgi:hypothetical protein
MISRAARGDSGAPMPRATDIARMLARDIDRLVAQLLPNGHREGHEWRCGSVAGEAGGSLGVHLTGHKAGIWCDFSRNDHKGDALDLVRAMLGLSGIEALTWSRRWLGIEEGEAQRPARALPTPPSSNPDRWRHPWRPAKPISGTLAETYLAGRGLRFHDPGGEVLRYAPRRARKNPVDILEHHPALLALVRDVRTGEACGIVNIYLRADGRDRIRDTKGKTVTGRAGSGAVMLSPFDEVTMGLAICEGVETGISLLMDDLAPVWCCGGAGGYEDRFADRFGLAYAAALLAIDYGVVSWDRALVYRSIRRVYRRALHQRTGPSDPVQAVVTKILQQVHKANVVDISRTSPPVDPKTAENANISLITHCDGSLLYALRPDFFKSIVGPRISPVEVARYLDHHGILIPRSKTCRTRQVRIPGLKTRRDYYCLKATAVAGKSSPKPKKP